LRFVVARSPLSSKDPSSDRSSDDDEPKPFDIEKKRLGRIMRYVTDKQYGFIEPEDFREDIFFHRDIFEPVEVGRADIDGSPVGLVPIEGLWVEFELDDKHFRETQKLRAKAVRPTKRPGGRKLSGRDATFQIVTHHPRARRKRPDWRG
jgi:'Cold-shock' DNA-binding domain